MHLRDGSSALTLQFFSLASDGAAADIWIQNRIFWSITYQFEEG